MVQRRYGVILQKQRTKAGLSQEELAFKAGVHRTYISQLERGLKCPSLATLLQISRALQMPLHQMLKPLS
jgi:transcriptional regulator with XRE-family HTH domain